MVDLLAVDVFPTEGAFCGVSFLLDGLLGVYFTTLSTLFLTEVAGSADLAGFFPLAADFEAAFFLPLPPLTLG